MRDNTKYPMRFSEEITFTTYYLYWDVFIIAPGLVNSLAQCV